MDTMLDPMLLPVIYRDSSISKYSPFVIMVIRSRK